MLAGVPVGSGGRSATVSSGEPPVATACGPDGTFIHQPATVNGNGRILVSGGAVTGLQRLPAY